MTQTRHRKKNNSTTSKGQFEAVEYSTKPVPRHVPVAHPTTGVRREVAGVKRGLKWTFAFATPLVTLDQRLDRVEADFTVGTGPDAHGKRRDY